MVGLTSASSLTRVPLALSTPEVAVMAEFFLEMLQRDFGYKLYKTLLALPEKEEPLEAKNPEPEKATELEKEGDSELKEGPQENPGAENTPADSQEEAEVSLPV